MVERMRVAWGGGFLARISRIIRLVWGAVSEAVGVDWVDRGKLKGERTEDGGRRTDDSPQRHRGHGEKRKKLCDLCASVV